MGTVAPKHPPIADLIGESQFSKLPTELWLLIVSFVIDKKDLLALCGTSARFRALTRPSFFKTVELLQWGERDRKRALLKMLQTPDLALLVTNFRAHISSSGACWDAGDGVDCAACCQMDAIVGGALLSMANLELLHITCHLCMNSFEGWHAYFNKLPTKTLRSLHFQCSLCTRAIHPVRTTVSLTSLATVKSLSCLPYYYVTYTPFIDEANVLPLVRNLAYYGGALNKWILLNRPIKRLYLTDVRGDFPQMSHQCPETLTHLILLSRLMERIPATFKSLQHVGTFVWGDRTWGRTMEDVAGCLPSKIVTSMDVSFREYQSPWSRGECMKMKAVLPLLRKILVHGQTFAVWELQGEIWEMREVDDFTPWDIICGDCDNL